MQYIQTQPNCRERQGAGAPDASPRPFITERGYTATRRGVEVLEKQIYAEALQRGLLKAESVWVIADGAIWIWNLAGVQDRISA